MRVHISYPEKISCPSIGFPAGESCHPDSCYWSVCQGCYGKGGQCRRFGIQKNLRENLEFWRENPAEFARELKEFLVKERPKYFRWQWNGDIPDQVFGAMVENFAWKFPGTKFLLFTKRWGLLRDYPLITYQNLSVRQSAHEIDDFYGPYSAFVYAKKEPPKGFFRCPGKCEGCRFCWNTSEKFRKIPVAFKWHGDAIMKQKLRKEGIL